MQLIDRNQCVLTGKADLEPIYAFRNFPVFMGCTTQPPEKDLKQDMNWWISRGTGLIQLNPLLPLDVLYSQSHNSGCIGALWHKHHEAFAAFVHRTNPTSALEIGGAHGILSTLYHQNFGDIPWTILEPNPTPVENCRAHFIKGFFDEKFSYPGQVDVVVHSHLLEHIYEPDVFIRQLAAFMTNGQCLVFSLPNMRIMLERNYTNCINFEHTLFLTEPYIEYLHARHGFGLINKTYFMDDHSIFYEMRRDQRATSAATPPQLYDKNKKIYGGYVRYHEELIRDLNQKIEAANGPVYLFGAHVFAQYLLAFGLDTSLIASILDNDPHKQGKRLYGTSLLVQSPQVLAGLEAPAVILKAGVYNQEIKKDILDNINPSTVFLE